MRHITLAGRRSKLAMVQNEIVKGILENEGFEVSILPVSTKGDRDKKTAVTSLGGNGPFVRDVEQALLDGRAHIAVHCVKDLPYDGADGLVIAGILDEADPGDVLLMKKGMMCRLRSSCYSDLMEDKNLLNLPQPCNSDRGKSNEKACGEEDIQGIHRNIVGWKNIEGHAQGAARIDRQSQTDSNIGAENENKVPAESILRIGTGSPRRRLQLMRLYSNITCRDIRGNITTRINKLREGLYDGIVLAKAGLDRIGADVSEFEVIAFAPDAMIPAVGQGLLAVQCRAEDEEMRNLLFGLSPAKAYLRFMIEREIFCRYRLDCRDAVGVYAHIDEEALKVDLKILWETEKHI